MLGVAQRVRAKMANFQFVSAVTYQGHLMAGAPERGPELPQVVFLARRWARIVLAHAVGVAGASGLYSPRHRWGEGFMRAWPTLWMHWTACPRVDQLGLVSG